MIEKLFLALAAGLAAAELNKQQQYKVIEPLRDVFSGADIFSDFDFYNDTLGESVTVPKTWLPPQKAEPYLRLLHSAEQRHGLPEDLLVRVAYQESRFRDDIISGQTTSSAGAVGMMQIIPHLHPDKDFYNSTVNPLNVSEAADYAAWYLAKYRRLTGTWQGALASYNWGYGNVTRKGLEAAPKETRDYLAQITHDVLGGIA